MSCPLSERQFEALRAIADFRAAHHRAPTLRELRDLLDLHTTSAPHARYQQLEALGALRIPRVGLWNRRAAHLAELTPLGEAWLKGVD